MQQPADEETATSTNIIALQSGQQKYGGPPQNWSGPPPTKGSEVFIGKIPRELTASDLLPVFESVGIVYEMRLMMDPNNGCNRGFAFVTYTTPADAVKAIQQLNNYEIRPKRLIGVIKSMENCRLFIGGIPKDKTQDEVQSMMSRVTDGVIGVILYSSINDKSKNRGFVFVEYESHRMAAIARKQCIGGRLQLWGKHVAVDWAVPEPTVDEEILSQVRILYVRNLSLTTEQKDLEMIFNDVSDNGVEKVKILNDFAFVHFVTRQQAEKAKDALQNQELNGTKMQIMWAKPVKDRPKNSYPKKAATIVRRAPPTQTFIRPPHYPTALDASTMWHPHLNFPHHRNMQPNMSNYPVRTISSYQPFSHQQPMYVIPNNANNQWFPGHFRNNHSMSIMPNMKNFELEEFKQNKPVIYYPNCATNVYSEDLAHLFNGCYADNVAALKLFCLDHNLGEPIIEICKSTADNRFSIKITVPNLEPPYNVYLSNETYETEGEVHQRIPAIALNYLSILHACVDMDIQ